MSRNTVLYSVRIGMVAGIFGAGYLCGSLTEHNANAQWGDVGGELLQKAAGSGGMIGSVAQLGTTITDMEKNVSGLQKNIDTLKTVKAAISGK
ncbi:hypothetical protein [Geomonas subterranea]|uniref:hypothetical protein n=1 Tax=Geomonas subterranea TaxID=2847989 RepID=UPI001CD282EB|nr:hypothetical protein [Geomonas fuzhouensis]